MGWWDLGGVLSRSQVFLQIAGFAVFAGVEPPGPGKDGKPVYLKDIWPTTKEINALMKKYVTSSIFKKRYADVFKGDTNWRKIKTVESETYRWNMSSTYVQNPPYFEAMRKEPEPIVAVIDARILAMFANKITTDP